jgi:hypothetical protein
VSVLKYVLELNEKTCVGALSVADAFEESAHLITRASFPKGLEVWVFNECHVLYFLALNWVYYGIVGTEICPMIGEISWLEVSMYQKSYRDKFMGEIIFFHAGTLGDVACPIIGVTTLGSNKVLRDGFAMIGICDLF